MPSQEYNTTPTKLTTTTLFEDTTKTENVCNKCNNYVSTCDNKMYGKYCIKAVYNYHRERGCKRLLIPGEIRGVFSEAYNEIRRVTIHNKYSYFDGHERDIPQCMEDKSLFVSHSLVHNLRLASQLKAENNDGGTNYWNSMK